MSKARKAGVAVIFALLSFASFYVRWFTFFTVLLEIVDYYVGLSPMTYTRVQVLLMLGFVFAAILLIIASFTAKKRGGGRRR